MLKLGSRKKDLCFSINNDISEFKCNRKSCEYDEGFRCGDDPYADDASYDETDALGNDLPQNSPFARQGKEREFQIDFLGVIALLGTLYLYARPYTGSSNLHNHQRNRNAEPPVDTVFS